MIVVNQTLARRFWPGGSAIGGRLAIDQHAGRVAEIVGVVGDVKAERIDGEDWPTIYSPYPQVPDARDDAGRAHRGTLRWGWPRP